MTKMLAGVTKLSTVDYPGELATVLYMSGCNMRCPYCHNREVVLGNTAGIPWNVVRAWLGYKSNITAVVISGGEPLMPENVELTRQIVEWTYRRGLKIKLDTNGTTLWSQAIAWHGWLSYVAVDYKGLQGEYSAFGCGEPPTLDFSWLAREYPGRCELRTTVHKKLLPEEALRKMALNVPPGVPWYWQKFRPCACFDMSLNDAENYTDDEMGRLAREVGACTRGCGHWDTVTGMTRTMVEDTCKILEDARKEADI